MFPSPAKAGVDVTKTQVTVDGQRLRAMPSPEVPGEAKLRAVAETLASHILGMNCGTV